jgi:HEPN domain-containing protein
MKEKVRYWVELSDYDFDTAIAMLKTGRYLYVGFMCHQSIEKILKAYFNSVNDEPAPFTHSLTHLAKKSNLYEQFSEELIDFLDILEPLNIEARYPSYKERLMKSLTKERCEFILEKTKTLKLWITEKF